MNKIKGYVIEAIKEFRQSMFKRSRSSRIRWSIASLFTLTLAYYAHTQYLVIGGGQPMNPWANPAGQLFLAMREVGIIAGCFGLLLFAILGLGDTPADEDGK